jgi:thiamine-monophosphate kinase
MDSEDQLVDRIAHAIPSRIAPHTGLSTKSRLRLGIGDDSAVITPASGTEWVISCDAFLEGVHFLLNGHPADLVGYTSLVRATSDVVAMGATPRFFLLTLALPASRTAAWLDRFLEGMGRAARRLGMQLAGGDTTKFPVVSISITVLGELPRGLAVTRSGAKPGDLIYLSGTLGRAQLGLQLIQSGRGKKKRPNRPLEPHLFYPAIRVELGAWLAQKRVASAMMDISDGLSTDLRRLCQASGVGARLDARNIPCVEIPPEARKVLPKRSLDQLQMALHGGEDYELLFTVPPEKLKLLCKAPAFPALTPIGEITRNKNVVIMSSDGRRQPLQSLGWDPFRKR